MSLLTVRYGLPIAIFLLGIVFLVIEPNSTGLDGFCGATGAALALFLLNLLFRVGVAGDRDRDREEDARRFFDEHGRWPDEAPELARRPRGSTAAAPAPEPPAQRPDAPRPLRDAARPGADPGSPHREPRREGGRLTRQRPSRRP